MKKSIVFLALIISFCACKSPEDRFLDQVDQLIAHFPGEVGYAVQYEEHLICNNNDTHFPMFSVVKFHQALAVCDKIRTNQVNLNSETNPYDIKVTAEDLKPDTWSPMRDKYPNGGIFSIRQLLEYSLAQSDNNACDILFSNIANPKQVEEYIHQLDEIDENECCISVCGIAWTEDEQHADMGRCYENWTTPRAATELLAKFYEEKDRDEYSQFVWNTMANCQTGQNRIPKYIAKQTKCIVHKTGTGGVTADGKVMGINDIACITLPNGRHFELAIFIKDADCTPEKCEEIIAQIAKFAIAYVEKL